MEKISVWITLIISVIIPFIGWIFNTLITNKINDLNADMTKMEKKREEDKTIFFKRLDEEQENVSTNYVRKDLYEQAMKFSAEHNDEKFKSLLQIMTTQFESVEDKIEELKKIVNDKFNTK